ncbi:competence protein CoiA family protein [Hydrogenophaga aquatica]
MELRTPYGIGLDGSLVHASMAERGLPYYCPSCNTPLTLKAGEVLVRHFAHQADTSCTGETIAHHTAKLLLAKVIREQIDNPKAAKSILLLGSCDCCHQPHHTLLKPGTFSGVSVEEPVGSFVCDVLTYRRGEPSLAIEVVVTHKVTPEKANELSVPWIELDAEAIINDPYRWAPISERLRPLLCVSCKPKLKRLADVAAKHGQPLEQYAGYKDPKRATYLAAIRECWKCKEQFISYWWSGVPFCQTDPPSPKPPTIQLRWSKAFGGKYWANCCPACGQLDGDNFLFLNFGGVRSPFAGLPLAPSEPVARHQQEAVGGFIRHMFRNI